MCAENRRERAPPYDTDLDPHPCEIFSRSPRCRSWSGRPPCSRPHAIIHGALRSATPSSTHARGGCLGARETRHRTRRHVSAMLAKPPAMLECHYVACRWRSRTCSNTITPGLDAASSPSSSITPTPSGDHGPRARQAEEGGRLALAKVKPLVIDYDDPEFAGAASGWARSSTRSSSRRAILIRVENAGRRMGRDHANYTSGTTVRSQGWSITTAALICSPSATCSPAAMGKTCVYLWTLPSSTATAGASLDDLGGGRHACLPAPGARPWRCTTHRRSQGHASLRRADRDGDPAQCAQAEKKPLPHVSSSSPPRRRRPRRCWRR